MQKNEYTAMFLSEESMWWYKGLQDVLLSQFASMKHKKLRILDAGCGTGKNMEMLQKRGHHVDGIDVSDDALAFCHKRGIFPIQKASIVHIPFGENIFDMVICLDVFGSLQEKERKHAIAQFQRVLKPGGVLLVQTAAYMWLFSQHDVVTGIKKRYTSKELQRYFLKHEWKIIKSSYRMMFLFPLLALIKLKKRFFYTTSGKAQTDQYVPHSLVNNVLTRIQYIENAIFSKMNLPFGTSVFLIVQKKKD